ncbi:MAG: ABC transporter substrate-binding protein, partial [Candidatus Hydrogenedentes bacterium]|nr:ABC transporter substrate-binding protein [Candidatus Hydrogenedentota bacterium]
MLRLVPLRPWLLLLLLTAHGSADDLAIRWWHFYGADTWPVMQRLVAEFETTHPGIDIFPEYQGSYDMLSRKLLAAIVAGGPPELCTLGCGEVRRFAETGWLAPVQLSSVDHADFFPAVLDAFTHNGQLWALPVEGAAYVLYWNRTLFREAGLPDHPPDTWEELCEFGRALTRDVDGDGRADHWGFARYDKELVGASTIFNLYFANEAPLLEGGAARIDVPEVVDVLRFWQSLETEHGITAPSLPPQAIQRGLVGMWIGGTFSYPALAAHLGLGLASIPPLRQTACLAGPDTVVLGKTDTAHESAAQEFLRWLTAPEQAVRLCTNLGYLPLRHSVLQHPEFTAFLHTHPAYRPIQDVMAHFKTKPAHPVWSEIQNALNTAREQVEWGRASPEAAAQTAQQAAKRALARYQQEQAPAPARTSGLLVVCGAALAAAAFWLRKNRDHSDSRDNRNRHEKIESFPPSHLPTFPPSHLPTFSRS